MSEKNSKIIFVGSLFVAAILAAGVVCSAKVLNHHNDNFALNLSNEELTKRTDKDYLIDINLLNENAPEYKKLKDGDKEALKHLVKAADILQNIQYKLDNKSNIALFFCYL